MSYEPAIARNDEHPLPEENSSEFELLWGEDDEEEREEIPRGAAFSVLWF